MEKIKMANTQSILSWSGGKDAMMVLYESKFQNINIVSLLTTVELPHNRIRMHHVHASLIELQAMRLKLPLHKVYVSENASLEEYKIQIESTLLKYKQADINHICYGDLFIEDIKAFRTKQNLTLGVKSLFPLWERDTTQLAFDFLKAGFKAIVVCVNAKYLSGDFVGREYNEAFLSSLPEDIDPCGENGEFHTFVYDGPLFSKRIDVEPEERIFKNLDLGPGNEHIDQAFWYAPLSLHYS
ncbi:MAG: diphthine--ammonia ligase [Bacteroidota bacterium]